MAQDPQLRVARLGDRDISYREAGEGPPLVLVHGLGGHSSAWGPQFTAFAPKRRVIAWDAPGYGSSTLPPTRQSLDDYAAALGDLLEFLDAKPADFVGHSLGAVIVAALNRRDRKAVRSAVFLHGVVGLGSLEPEKREPVRSARVDEVTSLGSTAFAQKRGRDILGSSVSTAVAAEIIELMGQVPVEGYLSAWEMMCESDIYPDLPLLKQPTLVICGSEDPVAPEASCRSVAERLSAGRLLVLDGVGHFGSMEAPELINRLVGEFIQEPAAAS